SDSAGARIFGAGRVGQLAAIADLEFVHLAQDNWAHGGVSLVMGSVTASEAVNAVVGLLPGNWTLPEGFTALGVLALDNAGVRAGFDTRADSVGAQLFGAGHFNQLAANTQIVFMHLGARNATPGTSVSGGFRLDVGDIDFARALAIASELLPGPATLPTPDFSVGALTGVYAELGFIAGTGADSAWAELGGGFELGSRSGTATLTVGLGQGGANARFEGRFPDRLGVADLVNLFSELVPSVDINLPSGGPFDLGIEDVALVVQLGTQSSFSVSGVASLLGIRANTLFAVTDVGGSPQLVAGVLVPSLGFGDLVPALENPVTDALRLQNAGMILTTARGQVQSADLSPEVREFYQLIKGSDTFTLDLQPGLNLFAAVPLDEGPLTDLVGLLSPDAGSKALMLEGNIPIFGGDLSDLYFKMALPPMAPAGSPEWFVAGQMSLEITGRPSVGVTGALTLDVFGDTVTFDIKGTIAIIAQGGIELGIVGGLSAVRPWVGPFGIDWLTLNEVRLAMGISPVAVRLGFLGDAVIGPKDIRVQAGIKINLIPPPPKPVGVVLAGESAAGLALSDITEFQQMVVGGGAAPIPTDALPNIAIRDLALKVATYDDPDIGVTAGIRMAGRFLLAPGPGAQLQELGLIDLEISKQGIKGIGQINAFAIGPLKLDTALIDLALTLQDQHLILRGGAEIAGLFNTDIDLMLSRDSLAFEAQVQVFNAFRATLSAQAAYSLLNPQFQGRFALYNDFGDEVTWEVIRLLIPVAQAALIVADGTLLTAQGAVAAADLALRAAILVATAGPKAAMDGAYAAYRYTSSQYSLASSNYSYYSGRCYWWGPVWECAQAGYWGSGVGFWYTQRSITWGVYIGARAIYYGGQYITNSPFINGLRLAISQAQDGLAAARREVNKTRIAVNNFQTYINSFQTCRTCPMPPVPFNIRSAEFEADLAGYTGNSSVSMRIGYQVFGNNYVFEIGWSGSIAANAFKLFDVVRNAIF
ncbi:MAG: hypothetical protein IH965_14335, partial [Gemmatimonadetes bacterium]|nr:hypothetical protein [Gemmatimonadota bacterium]